MHAVEVVFFAATNVWASRVHVRHSQPAPAPAAARIGVLLGEKEAAS